MANQNVSEYQDPSFGLGLKMERHQLSYGPLSGALADKKQKAPIDNQYPLRLVFPYWSWDTV